MTRSHLAISPDDPQWVVCLGAARTGSFGMRKRKLAVSPMDQAITELARNTSKIILVTWAADCAERALPFFEGRSPGDLRPRRAIAACREWVRTGVFRMKDVRAVSLGAHAAAIYAATAFRDASVPANAENATIQEREWQYRHLQELREDTGSGE